MAFEDCRVSYSQRLKLTGRANCLKRCKDAMREVRLAC